LLDGEHRAMSGREKLLIAHVIQKLEKRVIESADIEQPDGLEVQAELKPGKYFDYFFESANPSRQRYEGIGKLSHAMLALVHGLNNNKLRKSVMRALLCNHRARDDADDLTVSGQRGIGQHTHKAGTASAIDDA
jgi:hypothetical protein